MRIGRVCIAGAGQVGTMLGLALRRAEGASVEDVVLFDRDAEVAARGVALGAGTRVAAEAAECLDADVVVLALPVPAILRFVQEHGAAARRGSLVMDTGSAKRAVVEAMAAFVPPEAHAVGGHPMVGTERPGPDGARPELLLGSPFVLTPVREDPEAMGRAFRLVAAIGARPVRMEAADHDALVARTSHLPHVMAFALAEVVGRAGRQGRPVGLLASTGYRSSARLAASDPDMVGGLLWANAQEVRGAVSEFQAAVEDLLGALDEGPERLARRLAVARESGRPDSLPHAVAPPAPPDGGAG